MSKTYWWLNAFVRDKAENDWIAFRYDEAKDLIEGFDRQVIPLHLRVLAEQVLDDEYPLPDNHPWWKRTAEKLARLLLEHARLDDANLESFGLNEAPSLLRARGGDDSDVRNDTTAKEDFVFPHDNIVSDESNGAS